MSFVIDLPQHSIFFTDVSNDGVNMCVRAHNYNNFSCSYKFTCLSHEHTEQNIRELFDKFPPMVIDDDIHFELHFSKSCFFKSFKIEFIEFSAQTKKICEMAQKNNNLIMQINALEIKIDEMDIERRWGDDTIEQNIYDDIVELDDELNHLSNHDERIIHFYFSYDAHNYIEVFATDASSGHVFNLSELNGTAIIETFRKWVENKRWIIDVSDDEMVTRPFNIEKVVRKLKMLNLPRGASAENDDTHAEFMLGKR